MDSLAPAVGIEPTTCGLTGPPLKRKVNLINSLYCSTPNHFSDQLRLQCADNQP